jgi:hypothetical protein
MEKASIPERLPTLYQKENPPVLFASTGHPYLEVFGACHRSIK